MDTLNFSSYLKLECHILPNFSVSILPVVLEKIYRMDIEKSKHDIDFIHQNTKINPRINIGYMLKINKNDFLVRLKEHLITANVPCLGWLGGLGETDRTGVVDSSNDMSWCTD